MMDGLAGSPLPADGPVAATVALLPGSRAYAPRALHAMAAGLAALADDGEATAAWVAWTGGAVPPPAARLGAAGRPVRRLAARRRPRPLRLGRFADVLASADAVLGTSGTAQEQAAGLGLPVVSFPVEPAYGAAFLANQRRLLGAALEVVAPTPRTVAAGLRRALHDAAFRADAAREGPARLGPPGGTAAIAADVARRLVGAQGR
jgi:uncharacterized protein (TIGR03492 family)